MDWKDALNRGEYIKIENAIIRDQIPETEYPKILEHLESSKPHLSLNEALKIYPVFKYLWDRTCYTSLKITLEVNLRDDYEGRNQK